MSATDAQLKAAAEAEKLYDKADAFTRRTLTRWSPDWNEAAAGFERAAVKFRAAGKDFQPRLAKALLRAGEAYEELASLNSAAKCITQAMTIVASLNDAELRDEAASLCRKAADLYQANGQADKAAQTLVKGAAFFSAEHFKQAIGYYRDALAIYKEENREVLSHDTYKQAIAYSVKNQDFDMAIQLLTEEAESYKKQNSNSMHGCYLGIVVIRCFKRQHAQARTAIDSFDSSFRNRDEYEAANGLVVAMEEGDELKLENAKKNSSLKYIDTSVARLVKGITIDPDAVTFDAKEELGDLAQPDLKEDWV